MMALDQFMTISVDKWHIPFFQKQWEEQKRIAAFLKVKITQTRNSYLNSRAVGSYRRDEDVEF